MAVYQMCYFCLILPDKIGVQLLHSWSLLELVLVSISCPEPFCYDL